MSATARRASGSGSGVVGAGGASWIDAELEETEALMGADFHAEGYEQNRATIEVFAEQALAAGIVSRRISPEEYFAEYLEG